MPESRRYTRSLKPLWHAFIEITFILFLFYANLLMGEFTVSNSKAKSLAFALADIVTPTNFGIGLVSAILGFIVFEYLRRKV